MTDLSVSDIDDIYGARSALEGLLAEKGAAVRDDDRDGKPRLVRKLTEKHVMRSAAELRQLASRRSASPAQSDRSRGASG